MSKKVLIAEDEKPLANALKLKLEKAGIKASMVSNGKELFEKIAEDDFDLILLDLIMPEMNGFAVLEKINQEGIKIPVIVTSNLGQEEDIKKCLELGAKEYIIKSNTPISEIVSKVENWLKK